MVRAEFLMANEQKLVGTHCDIIIRKKRFSQFLFFFTSHCRHNFESGFYHIITTCVCVNWCTSRGIDQHLPNHIIHTLYMSSREGLWRENGGKKSRPLGCRRRSTHYTPFLSFEVERESFIYGYIYI